MKIASFARKARKNTGFSLVELLTVIAVLAIVASVGIASFSLLTGSSKESVAMRNAQAIVNLSSQAVALGNEEFEKVQDKTSIVDRLIRGVRGKGNLRNIQLKVEMSPDEASDASKFLEVRNGFLTTKIQ